MDKRKIALLHAKTNWHKTLVKHSRRIIQDAISKNCSWYVAYSGGKDSTVVANLLPELPRLYVDEEWLLPETEEYLQRTKNLHRIKKRDEHAEFFTAWKNEPDAWAGKNVTGRYAQSQGWGGVFLGLRKDESGDRKIHLRSQGNLFFSQSRQMWQCNPIADWSWRDVWAFIYANDLGYNRAYDRLDEIGIEPERQRIGPLAQRCVLGYGQIAILKRGWPELYNEFVEQFPEGSLYT